MLSCCSVGIGIGPNPDSPRENGDPDKAGEAGSRDGHLAKTLFLRAPSLTARSQAQYPTLSIDELIPPTYSVLPSLLPSDLTPSGFERSSYLPPSIRPPSVIAHLEPGPAGKPACLPYYQSQPSCLLPSVSLRIAYLTLGTSYSSPNWASSFGCGIRPKLDIHLTHNLSWPRSPCHPASNGCLCRQAFTLADAQSFIVGATVEILRRSS